MIKKFIYYYIIFLCLVIFNSCSENPINPNNEISFDSARYDWTSYFLDPYIIDVQAYDANNVFLLNPGSIYRFNGTSISLFYDLQFSAPFFKVISPNEIYLISSYEYGSKIYKYQNNQLDVFVNTVDTGLITSSFEYNNGDFWVGGRRGDIYKISNGKITKYLTDLSNYIVKIRVGNDNVYCCAFKDSGFKTFLIRYYKLNGTLFDLIYEAEFNHLTENNNVQYPVVDNISDNFFTLIMDKGFYQLRENNFQEFINLNGFKTNTYIAGRNNNYLFNAFYIQDTSQTDFNVLYNWNGKKFSKELLYSEFYNNIQKMILHESKFYIVSTVGLFNSLLYVGSPK